MERKIVITECMGRTVSAILENDVVAELHYSPLRDSGCRVGEIYVGKIKKILPNIHGAFIEIGNGLECYYSLEEKWPPVFTAKKGKKPFCVGDELLVQVQKEAVKTKQPVVTGNLNLAGKYAVITSGNRMIGVSSKLSGTIRQDLQELGESCSRGEFGIIFRTNAGGAAKEQILEEVEKLAEKYRRIITAGRMRTCFSCVYRVPDVAFSAVRNCRQEGLTEIVADAVVQDGALYREAEEFLAEELPEDLPKLRAYTDQSYPLEKCFRLEHVTEEARKERVWMKSGAYLVIQQTEALNVIDVNSGKCQKKGKQFAEINREAAAESARQIRLRNLSGIILIDFINLGDAGEKQELMRYLQSELSKDPNPGNVIDMTKLQLVEITRKKVRKTLEESLHG